MGLPGKPEVINGSVKGRAGSRVIFARSRTWLNDAVLEPSQTPLGSASSAQRTIAAMLVCTENLIRIDCATESPKRQRR